MNNWYRVHFEKGIRFDIAAEDADAAQSLALQQIQSITGLPEDRIVRVVDVEVIGKDFTREDQYSRMGKSFKRPERTPEEDSRIAKEQRDKVCVDMQKFIQKMKKKGVQVNVQSRIQFGRHKYLTVCQSSMIATDAVGALEYAKMITSDGIRSHQALDGLVQAAESRPDLLKRLMDALAKTHLNDNCMEVSGMGIVPARRGGGVSG